MMRKRTLGIGMACALGMSLEAAAQIKAIEPAQAGADFPFQGEYLGETAGADGKKQYWAAQVSAMGAGNFRAVFFPAGFPGSGWSGTGRVEIAGKRSGEAVPFAGSNFQVTVSGGRLSGTGPGGAALSLAKVERGSPTMGLKAPAGATVLFDGSGVEAWTQTAKIDSRGFLGVPSETRKEYGSFSLHAEFRTPFEPEGRGQGRGNSGICMTTGGWFEVQVLDSFGDDPLIDGCAALFNVAKPKVNACLPPLSWQTYDIQYQAPVLNGSTRVSEAKATVWLNGVLVQDKVTVPRRPALDAILLQDHSHPVFFRNIWIVEGKSDYAFPIPTGFARPAPRREGQGPRLGAPLLRGGGLVFDAAGFPGRHRAYGATGRFYIPRDGKTGERASAE